MTVSSFIAEAGQTETAIKMAQRLMNGESGVSRLAEEALSLVHAPRRVFDNPVPFAKMKPVESEVPLTDLKVGERGFIHPSSLQADSAGKLWLKPEDRAVAQTTSTIVGRTSRNGFQVGITDGATSSSPRWHQDWTHEGIPVGKMISFTPADEWGRHGIHVSSTLPEALRQMTVGELKEDRIAYISRAAARNLQNGTIDANIAVHPASLRADDIAVVRLDSDRLMAVPPGSKPAAVDIVNSDALRGPASAANRAPFDQPATLNESRRIDRNNHIKNMRPGEWGYTVPWAMEVDRGGRMFLKPDYRVHPEPGGTVDTIVRRSSEKFFHVDARDSYNQYFSAEGSADGLRVGKLISSTPPDEWERRSLQVSSRLPLTSTEMTTDTLKPGQTGWTVPWFRSGYGVHREPGGTVDTLLQKGANGGLSIVERRNNFARTG